MNETCDYKKYVLYASLVFLLFFFIIVFDITYNYQSLTLQPMIPKQGKPLTLEIKPATSAKGFATKLRSLGLVRSTYLLSAILRWQGLAYHLQAGIYAVQPGETVMQFVHRVSDGDVIVESLRIPEGATWFDVKQILQSAQYLQFTPLDLKPFIDGHLSVEGLFLADTYHYKSGSQALMLLRLAHRNLQVYLEEAWSQRAENLPYPDSYSLLIAASIIEKEAALAEERRIIAGIIVNRLKRHMPLQMDPTVIYALKLKASQDSTGKVAAQATDNAPLRHKDLSIESPYNTYKHKGLPPTPIAMVGKDSIAAAAHPTDTPYLYYYAKGDGTHQFSETYQQQLRVIQKRRQNGHQN